MAKLPSYTNQQTIGSSNLDTGQQFMRLQSANKDTGRAISAVGGALDQLADGQLKVEAKAARTAAADSNLLLESRLMDYQNELLMEAQKRADDMPEGGMGYASGLTEYATTTADKYIEKDFANRPDQEKVALRFQRVRQGFVQNALETEYKARLEWRGDVAGKKIADLQGAIGADPANYAAASAAWEDFVSNSIDGGSNTKERFLRLGHEKLARAELEAAAVKDPSGFRASFRGTFENQPTKMAEPHIAGIVDAANDNGLNPGFMLGVAQIESKVNPKAGMPTKRDGTVMSSATGMWQILAAPDTLGDLGISKEDRTNYDVATPAIARYFARQKASIEAKGMSATPGKLYMTWNIGPGAAAAVMSADPNTPIERVLTRVWARKGPAFIRKALQNNPSMYRPGMTVGQVVANYEAKMTNAMGSTKGYLTGANMTTDEQARAVFTSMGLKGGEFIGARDAAEVFADVNSKLGKATQAEQKLALGTGILNGDIAANPYDSDTQSAVNEAVAQADLSKGIASGDDAALIGAKARVTTAGFIPLPDVNAFRAAMNTDGATEPKLKAYAALTDIATNDSVAFDASKLPDDEKRRVNEYRAYTEVLSMSPADAVRRIDEARTPEGKRVREAMAKQFEGKQGELEQLQFADIQNAKDGSWWSDPEAVTPQKEALAVQAYRTAYRYHREHGKEADEAKALALHELDRSWGVSNVTGTQIFMPYPPERYYSANKTGGSYDWITQQARNTVKTHLLDTNQIKNRTFYQAFTMSPVNEAEEAMDDIEIRLIPTGKTVADIRSGKPPRYQLWYRKPNGTTDVVPGVMFAPNQTEAEQEHKAAEEANAEKTLKGRKRPNYSGTQNPIARAAQSK